MNVSEVVAFLGPHKMSSFNAHIWDRGGLGDGSVEA